MRLNVAAAVLVVLFFANTALAFDSQPSIDSITVKTLEIGKLEVMLSSETSDTFILSLSGEQPWMTLPVHVKVNAGSSKPFIITVFPYAKTRPTIYNVVLAVESLNTGEKKEIPLKIIVRTTDVAIEHIAVEGASPASEGSFEIFMKNYEGNAVTITVKYEVKGINGELLSTKSEDVSFEPKDFKVLKGSFRIPECYAAGQYLVNATLYYKGAEAFSAAEPFTVPKKVIIIKDRSDGINLLQSETGFLVRNIGNVKGVAEVSDDVWGSLFYSGDQPAEIQGGKYIWKQELGPCESAVVSYYINYTPIAGAFFVIMALWLVFFRIRSVKITKNVLQKTILTKGLEYTVGLNIKSFAKTKDVVVKDFVPPVFDVKEAHGGVKPEINKTGSGTELIWKFSELIPSEQRVVAYKIVPLVSVSGKIRLPRAHASFTHFGRTMLKMSPIAHIGEEIMEEAEEVETNLLQNLTRVFRFGK